MIDPNDFERGDEQPKIAYQRVMPRDLFNEASLFKMMGCLALKIMDRHPNLHIKYKTGEPFVAGQYESDGSITIINAVLYCKSIPIRLTRPLNSREPWPLYAFDSMDGTDVQVFTNDGEFTRHFMQLVETLESIVPNWERPDDALP